MDLTIRTKTQPPDPDDEALKLNDLVFLVVGAEKEWIPIHHWILVQSSEVLRRSAKVAASKSFPTILLPDQNPGMIKAYTSWLYGRFYILPPTEAARSMTDPKASTKAFHRLVDLFRLGLELDDTRYCNAVIDMIITYQKKTGLVFGVEHVNYAVKHVRPTSTLYQVLLQQRSLVPKDMWRADMDKLDEDFASTLLDMAFDGWTKQTRKIYPYDDTRCRYHRHDETVPECIDLKPWNDGPHSWLR